MINQVADEKSFYFSYKLDLTKTIQNNITDIIEPSKQTNESGISELQKAFPNSINYDAKFAFNHF